ncbi:MAG: M1 family metallopeptidase [Nocardioides sp.]|uniref:M1 family metallopeptidase n=1 Tax=Nocardioides sp. TaxID=35761 RepID=UPI003F048F2F
MTQRPARAARLSGALLAAVLVAGGCSAGEGEVGKAEPAPPRTTSPSSPAERAPASVPGQDLDLALSTPTEDTVYPEVGDPGVDALHYGLDLTWDDAEEELTGTAQVTFRATGDAEEFQLDLAGHLEVGSVSVDGTEVAFDHDGKDLVVERAVGLDERHTVTITYAGPAQPVPAPTVRSDVSTLGLTLADDGSLWTMQEPFGAHTWYPVNDHPSDKALYDVTVHAPSPMVGVSNGRLLSRRTQGGTTTTRWRLVEPAAPYLMTLAVDEFTRTRETSKSGVTLDYWTPRGDRVALRAMRTSPAAVDWLEERLGPYPFDTLGSVVVESDSAMETQTLVTYGNSPYTLSPPVVVHELAHQWFGDKVSPDDWSEVWQNEGITMLVQWMWESEHGGAALEDQVRLARKADSSLRAEHGPPGAYDADHFGSSNIYWSPAVMWFEVLQEVGEERFFEVQRGWLEQYDNTSVGRDEVVAYWKEETGLDLSAHVDAWLTGDATPEVGLVR